jgi:hypothetical protein
LSHFSCQFGIFPVCELNALVRQDVVEPSPLWDGLSFIVLGLHLDTRNRSWCKTRGSTIGLHPILCYVQKAPSIALKTKHLVFIIYILSVTHYSLQLGQILICSQIILAHTPLHTFLISLPRSIQSACSAANHSSPPQHWNRHWAHIPIKLLTPLSPSLREKQNVAHLRVCCVFLVPCRSKGKEQHVVVDCTEMTRNTHKQETTTFFSLAFGLAVISFFTRFSSKTKQFSP